MSGLYRRTVNTSNKPCVGCAWRPSPALMTLIFAGTCCAIKCAAPLCAWRTTNISACMAMRLSTVSNMVSPLDCDEVPTLRLITSADKRLAAISKVVRVRVLFSKKILQTVLPRSNGTFLMSRSATPTKLSAVSKICVRIFFGKPSMVSRCFSLPSESSCGLCITLFYL